jgi:hypothetical protein
MDEQTSAIQITDTDVLILQQEEKSALEYRERKHDDWTDNYTLFRDKVITNRLTQRQTINIPLMKYVLNTQLKEMMDMPELYFNNLSNNQQKEVYYNEYWKETRRLNKLLIKDHVDKKQNGLFGRAFKKINIVNGKIKITLVDPQCMLVHRFVDPTDIDSAPTLVETDIYVTLDDILENEEYLEEGKALIKHYFDEENGQLEADENFERASEKSDRLKNIGVDDAEDPLLGETYVELHEAYRFEWSDEKQERVIMRYVLAVTKIGMIKLHKAELCDVIGETSDNFWYSHFPYTSWASDPEATDFWSDGVADIIRPINKVLNAWISQLVENRTLQNFGMKYYDSTDKKFVPQTFAPQPWGHYPVPGDPNKIIKDVATGNLSGALEEMAFLINIAEKATAATAANSGSIEQRKVTLGEVEYALANAQKRIQIQQMFYTEDWRDLGLKYAKFMEACGDQLDALTVYKKGRLGRKMYKKMITLGDIKDDEGYGVEVKTVAEQQEEQIDSIEKLNILKTEMPDNIPLIQIYRKKLMDLNKLTPEEMSQIEEFEKQRALQPEPILPVEQPANANVPANANGSGGGTLPQVPDIAPKR